MSVGGRGDCIALDITIIDCFTRYAIAIPIPDQSSEIIVNALIGNYITVYALIGNYITVYGTPHRILTDQGKCFESALFHSFCTLFRINKIRTSGYRPQCTGICERFNQSLK